MKKLLPILCLLILVSCSNEVPLDQLVERNGITYEINSQTPFTGSFVNYHENGQLESKRNWKDGNPDGLWETYHENYRLESKVNWKEGKEEGLWEYYDEEGNLTKTEKWKDGELVE